MDKDIPDQDKYTVGLYCASNFGDVPLERDVTELIKAKPYFTLVDLIKYAAKNPVDEYEKGMAEQLLWFIEVWEANSENSRAYLSIFALDKGKKVMEFNDYEGKSEICLLPSAKAKDVFEKIPKDSYRLDLWVNLALADF